MAIKRLSGRYSTLVANPRKRGARRNPAASAAEAKQLKKVQAQLALLARKQQLLEEGMTLEQVKAATKRSPQYGPKQAKQWVREGYASYRDWQKAQPKTERLPLYAQAGYVSAEAYRAAKRAGRASYRMRPLPAGATAIGYTYPQKVSYTVTKGKNKGQTRKRTTGLYIAKQPIRTKKPGYTLYKDKGGNMRLHKNPRRRRKYARRNAGLVIAGVPVVEMAIGSAATIAVGAVSEALIKKYAGDKVPAFLQGIVGEIATAGIAAFAHGKLKNPMHREIAKYAFIGAVFQIISEKASPMIVDGINKALPADAQATSKSTEATGVKGVHGGYMPLNGLYLSADSGDFGVGGAYMQTNGSHSADLGGLGLFQGKSIYG